MTRNASDIRFSGIERGRNGKISVRFDLYGNRGGMLEGFCVMTATSAPVFMSYGAALKGARRALATATATGKLPNLCERF